MNQLLDAAALSAVVLMLVSLVSPFVESVPGLQDTPENKPRHDAALRLLNVLLNVGVVFLAAGAFTGITLADVLPLIVQALAQAAGAHMAYHVVTQGPQANGSTGPDLLPGDYPPGAPSLAALGLPDGPVASGDGQQMAASGGDGLAA